MILIGSRALALRAPVILNRKPLDFDCLCDEHNNLDYKNVYAEIILRMRKGFGERAL